jgi:hypothetical protein
LAFTTKSLREWVPRGDARSIFTGSTEFIGLKSRLGPAAQGWDSGNIGRKILSQFQLSASWKSFGKLIPGKRSRFPWSLWLRIVHAFLAPGKFSQWRQSVLESQRPLAETRVGQWTAANGVESFWDPSGAGRGHTHCLVCAASLRSRVSRRSRLKITVAR